MISFGGLAKGDQSRAEAQAVPFSVTFGAIPPEPLVRPASRAADDLLAASRQEIEPAGAAWASSLRAALPVYQRGPTVPDFANRAAVLVDRPRMTRRGRAFREGGYSRGSVSAIVSFKFSTSHMHH